MVVDYIALIMAVVQFNWKNLCKNISAVTNQTKQQLIIAATMVLLLAGKVTSWSAPCTDFRMKLVNKRLTPQNCV